MTVKELIEKTAVPVFIVDGWHKYFIGSSGLLYDTFGNCIVNEILPQGDALAITLKMQLARD